MLDLHTLLFSMEVGDHRHAPAAFSPGKRPGTHFAAPRASQDGCVIPRPDCPVHSVSLYRQMICDTDHAIPENTALA